MQRVQGLLRPVDRVQQRSRWLGFPLAVMRIHGLRGSGVGLVIELVAFAWAPGA